MAAIRKDELVRLSGAREYADYILRARKRFEQDQAATIQELRKVYRRAAESVRRDIENLTIGTLQHAHLSALANNLDQRARELNKDVLRLARQGIYLSVDTGTQAARDIAGDLLEEAWPKLKVGKLFAPINERAVLALLSRTGKDGLKLSDRVWRIGEKYRKSVTRLVADGVARGLDSRKLAREVQQYLTPGRFTAMKQETRQRLGVSKDISYEAMRLARSEMNNAFHEASIAANAGVPGYRGIYWRLSASHPIRDICDDMAATMEYGEPGFYPEGKEPPRPHPQCMCVAVPAYEDPDKFADRLNEWMDDPSSQPDIERWYKGFGDAGGAGALPLDRPSSRATHDQALVNASTSRTVTTRRLQGGANLLVPVDLDTTKQLLTEKEVTDAFSNLSLRLRNAVSEVHLVDYRNPDDSYWETTYNIPGFRSWGGAEGSRIVLFANDHLTREENLSDLARGLAHEAAHALDGALGWFSTGSEWQQARTADAAIAKALEWATEYARATQSPKEDFAESVAGYFYGDPLWKKVFPNRTKAIWRKLMR